MMLRLAIAISFTLVCWSCSARAQSQSPAIGDAAEAARVNRAHKLSAIFARMEAPDRPRREAAFEDLLKFLPANDNVESEGLPSASFLTQNTDEAKLVRGALIRLLSTENNPPSS